MVPHGLEPWRTGLQPDALPSELKDRDEESPPRGGLSWLGESPRGGSQNRTGDLQDMNLTSYRCSTPLCVLHITPIMDECQVELRSAPHTVQRRDLPSLHGFMTRRFLPYLPSWNLCGLQFVQVLTISCSPSIRESTLRPGA